MLLENIQIFEQDDENLSEGLLAARRAVLPEWDGENMQESPDFHGRNHGFR